LLWALLVAGAGPATAGGGRLAPVQERYEPGGTATVVGYTAGPAPDRPFYAYLRAAGDGTLPALDDAGRYVGELVVEETAHGGYLQLRVSLTFDVPEALAPGNYEVTYCDDPCTGTFLGDVVPSPVSIGVDPPRPVVREWAPDDPEVANLAAGALLVGPGLQTTAGALRSPPSTVAPAPPPVQAQPQPQPPAPAQAPAVVDDDREMAWPVPTALVLASAAGTALVLGRRARAVATRPPAVPVGGRAGGAFAGRG
jgi:hypothetical protein